MNLFTKRTNLWTPRGRIRGEWYKLGDWGWHIYTAAAAAKLLQSCPTLCDPIDGCPSASPIPGILQARLLEWGAIAFSHIYNTMCKLNN